MACNDFPNNPNIGDIFDTGTQVFEWTGDKWIPVNGADPSNTTTESTITQVAHNFVLANCVAFDGVDWVLASSAAVDTTANGVVIAVLDADTFTMSVSGRYQLGLGLTPDTWYYLSTGGTITPTEPGISQPIVYSEDGDWVIVYPYRPSYAVDPNAQGFWTPSGDDIFNNNPGRVLGLVSGTNVTQANANFLSLTQAEYDAIGTPDDDTFYLISP